MTHLEMDLALLPSKML